MSDRFADVAFGSSGIRGRYGQTVTPELALALGRSAAQVADEVVVGRDPRPTGPALGDALVAGLVDGGADVTRIGVAPTPAVAHAARDHDLGVVVTASHNPPSDNGFKLWNPDGSAIGEHTQQRLLDGLDKAATGAWDAGGRAVEDPRPVEAYLEALLDHQGPLPGEARLVVDPGNGAASRVSPRALRRAGARVLTMNAVPDGTFPARPSEPTPENLERLAQVTEATDAMLGLAHDGDGDRVACVDETGRILQGDHVIVLLARALRAEKIAVPVSTSRLVWDALPDVEVETTHVGDAFVSEALADGKGDFGGEPSGAMVFPEVSLCPDGPHAALLLAKVAAREGGLADPVDDMPDYVTLRESADCPDEAKQPAMAHLQGELAALGDTTVLDGVRLDTDEGWALVRPSGTEPKLRVTAEAEVEAEANRLMTLVRGIVDETLHEVGARA